MYWNKSVGVTFLLISFGQLTNCAKILGVFMGLGRGHYDLGRSLMLNLVEAGHDCVLISRYSEGRNDVGKYREIIVRDDEHSDALFKATKETNHNPLYAIHRMHKTYKRIIPKVFEEPQVKALMNETFDLVMVEEVFVDALKVFAWHFKAHLVVFHPHRANFWVNIHQGNPSLPSFISEYPSTLRVMKNYFDRLQNVVLYVFEVIYKEFVNLEEHRDIAELYFPSSPDLPIITYNTSLALLNSDVAVHQSVPTVPSMVDIGGFHIGIPKKLPVNVFEFCNNSTEGVVFIDMDFLTSSYMPEETRNGLVKAFSKIDRDFLWIWDEDSVPNQPQNLMIKDTLPLEDVLAHPNVKLFVHLGDTKDIIAGVHYGVPQLLIPVLDDQLYDTAQADYYGYAKTLPYSKLTEENFVSALKDLFNNSRYTEESRRRSKILKDKPISPKKSAVFWIEQVLKTNGAPHLRADSLDYTWYQLYLFDVLALFVAVILLVTYLLIKIVTTIWRICCGCGSRKKNAVYKSYNSLSSIAE